MLVLALYDRGSLSRRFTLLVSFCSALTLASPEIRFHIDSETHDPIDVQAKQILYVIFFLAHRHLCIMQSSVFMHCFDVH